MTERRSTVSEKEIVAYRIPKKQTLHRTLQLNRTRIKNGYMIHLLMQMVMDNNKKMLESIIMKDMYGRQTQEVSDRTKYEKTIDMIQHVGVPRGINFYDLGA